MTCQIKSQGCFHLREVISQDGKMDTIHMATYILVRSIKWQNKKLETNKQANTKTSMGWRKNKKLGVDIHAFNLSLREAAKDELSFFLDRDFSTPTNPMSNTPCPTPSKLSILPFQTYVWGDSYLRYTKTKQYVVEIVNPNPWVLTPPWLFRFWIKDKHLLFICLKWHKKKQADIYTPSY